MDENKQKRGFFITLEGGEGAGKSSQIRHLAKSIEAAGFEVVTTREPGGTKGAEILRHVLLSGAAEKFGPHMEAILFSAARADHVELVIRPALEAGKVVICDRFIDSTRVYQGVSGDVEMSFLKELEEVVCEQAWPDLTLLLDISPEEGMKRAVNRRQEGDQPDRFEKEAMAAQTVRRDAFIRIAEEEPDRVVVIDAEGSEDDVAKRIWNAVAERLPALKEASP